MPNLEYEGPINVYDKKSDGTTLVISKGDRAGEPYYKVSFKVGGEYVNLMDFEGITHGVKGDYRITYYQKFAPNGDPELYNGKPQYQLDTIEPAGATHPGTQAVHSATATSTQGTGSLKPDFDPNLSRRQTAANDATRLIAATAGAMSVSEQFDWWTRWAEHIDAWLSGKTSETNELDQMLNAAKEAFTDPDTDDDIPFG